MKHLLYIIILATLTFSCSSEPKTENITEKKNEEKKASCTYALGPGGSASVNWTAFKFTEKVGVGGTFDQCRVGGNKNITEDLPGLINGTQFIILTGSINSKNPERDTKIVKSFFGAMTGGDNISGIIKDAKGTNRTGRCNAALNMNGVVKDVNLAYTLKGEELSLSGNIDLAAWDAIPAVDALNEVCSLLHKGEDGKSKLWPTIDLNITSKIKVVCPE
ncbi:MAG: hypothetical protein ACI8XB_002084 [Patiriisocius sp.]|jgi:hypothetical protein